jgi:hypothetical protein
LQYLFYTMLMRHPPPCNVASACRAHRPLPPHFLAINHRPAYRCRIRQHSSLSLRFFAMQVIICRLIIGSVCMPRWLACNAGSICIGDRILTPAVINMASSRSCAQRKYMITAYVLAIGSAGLAILAVIGVQHPASALIFYATDSSRNAGSSTLFNPLINFPPPVCA